MIFLVILLIISLIIFLYQYYKNVFNYWEKKDIPAIKPKFIFSDVIDLFFFKHPIVLLQKELYQKLAPHKVAGFYFMTKPILMIRDPELIKRILIKDFQYFHNRSAETRYPEVDPIMNKTLVVMEDEEWRNTRIKLSRAFTIGKMKMMFSFIKKCGGDLDKFASQQGTEDKSFEVTNIFERFTVDVIANCAFGVESFCLKDPNSEFHQMATRFFKFKFKQYIRSFFPNITPAIVKRFNLKFIDSDIEEFFTTLVKETVQYREENNFRRNDFLDVLIDLKNNTESIEHLNQDDKKDFKDKKLENGDEQLKSNTEFTLEFMVAQTLLFFSAGSESTASTLAFAILEMAQNHHIQEKIRAEILDALNKYNKEFCYDMLKDLTFMDMVIDETLRKYPVPFVTRVCTANYKIPDTKTIIEKGTDVAIPVAGLHSDKLFYEYPDKFYPEHFSEEAKANRPEFSYIPFGGGPRICIAERFAKMEMKVALFSLLKDHKFYLSPKMKFPLEFTSPFSAMTVKGGIWVTCKNI